MPAAAIPLVPPRGSFYVGSSLATVQAWASQVDAAQGYPKAGVFAAPGPFQPATPFVTQRYAEILQHPTLQQWCYPSDAVIDVAIVGASAVPIPGPLTPDWAGTQPIAAEVGVQALAQRTLMRRVALGAGIALVAASIAGAVAMGPGPAPSPTLDAGALDAEAGE